MCDNQVYGLTNEIEGVDLMELICKTRLAN